MTQNATIKTLTDLQKLAIVADYINSLLEKQQQLESDSELINYHTKRLAKLNILRQVLQQKGNQSLDAKYGMNLGTKLGRRILYIMDNVNKLCSNEIKEFTESNDARIEIDTWLVVSVLFGIYEYFNKNKANLPRDILNCDLVNLENKITSMKVQLSEKLYFQVAYLLESDKVKYRGHYRQTISALKILTRYNFTSVLSIQNYYNLNYILLHMDLSMKKIENQDLINKYYC